MIKVLSKSVLWDKCSQIKIDLQNTLPGPFIFKYIWKDYILLDAKTQITSDFIMPFPTGETNCMNDHLSNNLNEIPSSIIL